MIDVIFNNRNDKNIDLGSYNTVQECINAIHDFLQEHNYTIHYTRANVETDGKICIDVGSHTEFFYLDGCSWAEYMNNAYERKDDENV